MRSWTVCNGYSIVIQIYAALTGVKIVNTVTNGLVRILGCGESGERFLTIALYQVRLSCVCVCWVGMLTSLCVWV